MGEVYEARDQRLNRTVAIKVLPRSLAKDKEAAERFAREARAIVALNHPNICTLHDVGDHDGVAFRTDAAERGTAKARFCLRRQQPVS